MRRIKIRTLAFALAAVVGSGIAAADSDLWLHVKVDESDGAKVVVNLPISIVEKAIPMIPSGDWNNGHIRIDGDHEWSVSELRELWQEVSSTQDMTFEYTKCCWPPRTSQIPSSGFCQLSHT